MKFKLKGTKQSWKNSSKIEEPKEKKVKYAKIKIKPLSEESKESPEHERNESKSENKKEYGSPRLRLKSARKHEKSVRKEYKNRPKLIMTKSKSEGKYVKDKRYYKAKILNPSTTAEEAKKYYKLMEKAK